jgi:type IV pilus assembly protein PilW
MANNRSDRQRGLTLIELMLGVTLGFLVSGVVLSLYINTSRSLAQNERYAWMQENARFSLKTLSEDLSMADFWGQVIATDVISTNVTPPVGDCGVDIDVGPSSPPAPLSRPTCGRIPTCWR